MKRASFLFIFFAIISLTSCKVSIDTEQNDETSLDYFQLKIFTYETAEQEARLDKHFQDALLPALHNTSPVAASRAASTWLLVPV